jgi:hypothetical protein
VKWFGYLKEESTWESEANLEHAQDEIKDFHKKHPAAPQRIRELTLFKPFENLTKADNEPREWWNGKLYGLGDKTLKGGRCHELAPI